MVRTFMDAVQCHHLEIWRALNIGQDQRVQIHRSLISVELELQLTSGLPVPGVALQSKAEFYHKILERPATIYLVDRWVIFIQVLAGRYVGVCVVVSHFCNLLKDGELCPWLGPSVLSALFFYTLQLKFKTISVLIFPLIT